MSINRIAIQEDHNIPGYHLYGGRVPEKFTLRAMTTVEEKLRLSSNGFDTIPRLIKACTVSPSDIDIGDLKMFDVQFLMYKLRTVTYGSDYKVSLKCPHCGEDINTVVDLDSISVTPAEDIEEPFTIGPLPVSGDVLECRILTVNDYSDIARESKRIKNKNPNYVGDPEFIQTYIKKITRINGEDVKPYNIQKYVEEMNARDMRYFDTKYSKFADGLGMDTVLTEVCPKCSKDFMYGLPITEEFFRPTYTD